MRLSRLVTLLMVVVAWPLFAADEKPAAKAKEKAEPKEKLVKAGEQPGRLVRLPDKGVLTLSVYIGKTWQEVELPLTDDLKVRRQSPPQGFDDKGRPKKYTPKELDEMRGPDKKLPGYTAELTDLKPGQVVTVQLVKKAGKPKTKEEAEYKPRVGLILINRDP